MKITRKQLRQIIREEIEAGPMQSVDEYIEMVHTSRMASALQLVYRILFSAWP